MMAILFCTQILNKVIYFNDHCKYSIAILNIFINVGGTAYLIKKMPFFLLVLSLFLTTCYSRVVPVPKYEVNITIAPMERWAHVIKDYAQYYPQLFEEIESKLPNELLDEVATIADNIDDFFSRVIADEMRGISKYGKVTLARVVLLNLLYDLFAYDHNARGQSVSVVVNSLMDPNNPIIAGHVMDYIYSDILRDLAITIEVVPRVPGVTPIFIGTTFAGMVGVLSGYVAGGISMTYTERVAYPHETWKDALIAFKNGKHNVTMLEMRYILEQDLLDFSPPIELSIVPLMAPSYIMLGLTYDGLQITRDRLAALDKLSLSRHTFWYLVQTNYDHWIKEPSDGRKEATEKAVEKIGRNNVDANSLSQALLTPGIVNYKTAYVVGTTPDYWGPYYAYKYYPDD